MDIINHFACYTRLPIRLADIAAHIIGSGEVATITRYPVDMDADVLQGCLHVWQEIRAYDRGPRQARILYAKSLDPRAVRLVCTKEMLHIMNGEHATVSVWEQVNLLVNQLSVGSIADSLGIPAAFDMAGQYHALAVLLPRDALDALRPSLDAKTISEADVAKFAQIPLSYAQLAVTHTWRDLLEAIV